MPIGQKLITDGEVLVDFDYDSVPIRAPGRRHRRKKTRSKVRRVKRRVAKSRRKVRVSRKRRGTHRKRKTKSSGGFVSFRTKAGKIVRFKKKRK